MKILIGYSGEISLKSTQVERKILGILKKRITEQMQAHQIDAQPFNEQGRLFIAVKDDTVPHAVNILSTTPGINYLAPCLETGLEQGQIWEQVQQAIAGQEPESFAVRVRRVGDKSQHPYTSKQLEEQIGQHIVDQKNWPVDLDNPDLTVHIEARHKKAYIYTAKIQGIGGMPVNKDDTIIARLKDRIDAYSAALLMRRGANIIPVYNGRHAEETREGLRTLQQMHPDTKLIKMNEDTWETAVNKTADLFSAKAISIGLTHDQIQEFSPDPYNRTVLKPTCGMSEEEALEQYWELAATNYIPAQ